MSEEYGCAAVLVDAKPDALDFYARFGFSSLQPTAGQLESRPAPTPLFIPLELVLKAIGSRG
jgi:hypothetical protein